MTLSLNERAAALADRLADDADALRVAVETLPGGTRLIDCGSAVPGGLEAGRRFAEITMGGLGAVSWTPVVLDGRWFSGLTVVTDHPPLACLGAQYAGWQIKRDDYFAMASGPGRALIRAEDLYDDLDVDERAGTAVLTLETGDAPPEELAAYIADRAGVAPGELTLLFAPTASLAGGVQIAARIVETALHKLHELDFEIGRVVSDSTASIGTPCSSVAVRAMAPSPAGVSRTRRTSPPVAKRDTPAQANGRAMPWRSGSESESVFSSRPRASGCRAASRSAGCTPNPEVAGSSCGSLTSAKTSGPERQAAIRPWKVGP